MRIFLICPVRNATVEQIEALQAYKTKLQEIGHEVYYPDDNNPYELTDTVGYVICMENKKAIQDADEVHIFWDATSKGTLFDLGVAFALNKPLKIINIDEVKTIISKSFSNMIIEWSKNEQDYPSIC